jgi:protein SCO1/2
MNRVKIWLPLMASLLLCGGCGKQESPENADRAVKPAAIAQKKTDSYDVKGVIKEVRPEAKELIINHEEIPNYMAAMTMPFEVRNTNDLLLLAPGDYISFKLLTTDTDAWITNIQMIAKGSNTVQATDEVMSRVSRDLDPLEEGMKFPNYTFTNEFGKEVELADFKGKAIALTFIFTTCPLPTFCPRMSMNFAEAQKLMLANPAVTNWQLISLTFDPKKDTPAVLRGYGRAYQYNTNVWTFLTGDLKNIGMFSYQFGQYFYEKDNSINHNLRTVVVNADGTIRKILIENKWTASDLVKELTEAAAKPD